MKIAFFTSSYPRFPGDGAGTFVKSLAEALADHGHAVFVLAPYDTAITGPQDRGQVSIRRFRYIWPARLSILGHARSLKGDIALRPLAFVLMPLFLLAGAWQLARLVRRERVDLVYGHWLLPGGLVATLIARMFGLPSVIHLHGSDVFVAERNPVFRMAARLVLGWANAVFACSSDLGRRAAEIGVSQNKIHVVPYGVDTARFRPLQAVNFLPGERPEFAQARPLILAIGRLVHKKGFRYLLEAMPAILEHCPQARLVVGGRGELGDELRSLSQSLGVSKQVRFPGHIPWDRANDYLNLADVFVLPSVRDAAGNVDGLPNVLLEAMAAGLPIVATEVAGIPSVISHGEQGLLVPEKDPAALAAAVTRLLADGPLREKLGAGARARAEKELTWKHAAERISLVLGRLTPAQADDGTWHE